ncbi:MAG: hypothetical protein AAFN77_06775 [Planctomycetota bacterium]
MSSTTQLPEKLSQVTFGFFDVIELPELGYCGGLLIVSSIGRPLEFHCTAPVSTNRTQQIMYGQTYLGFLYADQIGGALIDRLKQPPAIMMVQNAELLPISEMVDGAVVMFEPRESTKAFDGVGLHHFETEQHRCWIVNHKPEQVDTLTTHVSSFAEKLPLDEPMERIAQAIEEAHSVLRAA